MTSTKEISKVKLINSSKVTEVLAVCAFAFAFVSFLSGALGLNDFAFENSPWRGFLISFGIQGILVTMNLNMPKFSPKIHWIYRLLIGSFYLLLLITSAIFSFVYITNHAYSKTYYVDTHALAENHIITELGIALLPCKVRISNKNKGVKKWVLDRGDVI